MGISANLSRNIILALLGVSLIGGSVYGYHRWSQRITPEKIAAGKALFEHDWTVDDPLTLTSGDGLGPVFNETSCVACHFQGGVGGAGPNRANVTSFTVLPESGRSEMFEGVVHANAIPGVEKETVPVLDDSGIDRAATPGPPPLTMEGCAPVASIAVDDFDPVVTQPINTPALFGLAEIERIPNYAILFHTASRTIENINENFHGDFSGNAAGQTTSRGGTTGRFGWRGQHGTIEEFVAQACAVECGLSNRLRKQDVPGKFKEDQDAALDITDQQLHELVCFVRSLPRPVQMLPEDPELKTLVDQGEVLFGQIGCAQCHVPELGGVEGIYSDFNLYNLTKPEFSSEGGGGQYGEFLHSPSSNSNTLDAVKAIEKWKTPPLWGVADSAPYMHDGSAPNLEIAIDQHHRDASSSRQMFSELSKDKRRAVIAFLKSLRSPYATVSTDELIQGKRK